MPIRKRAVHIAIAAAAASLTACASAGRHDPVAPGGYFVASCAGERYVEVANHAREPLDVYVRDGRGQRLLGVATGITERLPIPAAGALSFYAARSSARLADGSYRGSLVADATFSVGCVERKGA